MNAAAATNAFLISRINVSKMVIEKDVSTQFLQMQKSQLIELQEHLERYCNVLPVFGFNSAKYDINLIKSYLLPILNNERNIEPIVIKKANQFVSFKFGDVQLLDTMNFLMGQQVLTRFLKLTKQQKLKASFCMNGSTVHKR